MRPAAAAGPTPTLLPGGMVALPGVWGRSAAPPPPTSTQSVRWTEEGNSIMADFIGRTDAGELSFATNFSTLITAGPVPLGLTALQATTLAGYLASYSASLTAST